MNIELLLKKCAVRDHGAWEEFTGLYSGLIKRSIRYKAHSLGITLSETDVNDITQETFLSIWDKNKLSTVKDPSSLRGWLAMVSINMTSNYCRRNMFGREKILVSLDSCEIGNNLTMKDILPDAGISTDRTASLGEIWSIINKEISKMGTRERLAMKFTLHDGLKQKDISRIMHIPASTVANMISRAKRTLREKLAGIWDEYL